MKQLGTATTKQLVIRTEDGDEIPVKRGIVAGIFVKGGYATECSSFGFTLELLQKMETDAEDTEYSQEENYAADFIESATMVLAARLSDATWGRQTDMVLNSDVTFTSGKLYTVDQKTKAYTRLYLAGLCVNEDDMTLYESGVNDHPLWALAILTSVLAFTKQSMPYLFQNMLDVVHEANVFATNKRAGNQLKLALLHGGEAVVRVNTTEELQKLYDSVRIPKERQNLAEVIRCHYFSLKNGILCGIPDIELDLGDYEWDMAMPVDEVKKIYDEEKKKDKEQAVGISAALQS